MRLGRHPVEAPPIWTSNWGRRERLANSRLGAAIFRACSIVWLITVPSLTQSESVRNSTDVERVIALIKAVAPTYEMQDIVYTQKLVYSQRRRMSDKWRLVAEQYSARVEHNGSVYWQSLKSPNEHTDKRRSWRVAGVGCKINISNELTQLPLNWISWADVRGHRSAVFNFSVPKKTLECNLDDGHKSVSSSISGTVYADAGSGHIWRIAMSLVNDSPFPQQCTETYDYDDIRVGSNRRPVLVSRVEDTVFSDHEERIEWTYSNFRTFQVDSSIVYASPE